LATVVPVPGKGNRRTIDTTYVVVEDGAEVSPHYTSRGTAEGFVAGWNAAADRFAPNEEDPCRSS